MSYLFDYSFRNSTADSILKQWLTTLTNQLNTILTRPLVMHIRTPYHAGDTTPSVMLSYGLDISNSAATTITAFDDGVEGQLIVLNFNDANTTVDRTTCVLAGGANFVSTQWDTLTLIKRGPYWWEVARSVNS